MKKEILRGFTMLALLVAVAFVTAVASANGQSRTLKANVPFEFTVGNETLPAGEYTVKEIGSSAQIMAISNGDEAVVRLSNSIEASKVPERGKLVFHRYGQQYFLSEVWSAGESTGRKLLKSKQERRIESQLASIFSKSELAHSGYEVVEIVAMFQ